MRRFRCDSIYVSYGGGARPSLYLDLTALMPAVGSAQFVTPAVLDDVLRRCSSTTVEVRHLESSVVQRYIREFPGSGHFRLDVSAAEFPPLAVAN